MVWINPLELDWPGLGSLARGFGLDWIVSELDPFHIMFLSAKTAVH